MESEESQATKNVECYDSTAQSVEQLCQEFSAYKARMEEEKRKESLPDYYDLGLTEDFNNIRQEMANLKTRMNEILNNDKCLFVNQSRMQISASGDSTSDSNLSKPMSITCNFTKCPFDHCNRLVDGQVMLLHCVSDHEDMCGHGKYIELAEGECAKLTFDPKLGKMNENQVLGLLTYSGTIEEKIFNIKPDKVYNAFLPDRVVHLEAQIPIVVMLCKAKTCALFRDKKLAKHIAQKNENEYNIYVIWLVSPNMERQINATLTLSGRDANDTIGTTLGLRYMGETQNTNQFMIDTNNFWRLTYKDMQIISNNFEDNLVLQISLTEYQ